MRLFDKLWIFLKASTICLYISNEKFALADRQCCPPGTHLIENSPRCSDNRTRYSLTCESGALLLDPGLDEGDRFRLESNGSLIVFADDEKTEGRFCISRIQRNESGVSSNMVALVCFSDENDSEEINVVSVIHRLLMVVSTVFLLLTLYIYLVLPNLRDAHEKYVIAFICSLAASYTTLIVIQTFPNSSQEACVVQAALLYFFMSSCFFWNNVISFNIWKTIRRFSFPIKDKTWTMIYFSWGFGVPLFMVVLCFVLEYLPGEGHVKPRFAETKCWFKGELESWSYFHGPVSVLLLLNTIMFLQSCWILWRDYRLGTISRIRSLRFKCLMYLKLFLLMGISWIFEIISYATQHASAYSKYLWFLADCLNSAQGVFIFLILVVCRQKVRLGILKKKLLGLSWPQSWAKEDYQESSILSYADDLELAKQKIKILEESQPCTETN